ncbi:hypothetical protein CC2G_006916 [Coprinopsis cinerea AmutBmut pab1-1]|nr:hypothetical protein CC2G_006916 [Coprinopsis cinerea AmutBmut pab1-1]
MVLARLEGRHSFFRNPSLWPPGLGFDWSARILNSKLYLDGRVRRERTIWLVESLSPGEVGRAPPAMTYLERTRQKKSWLQLRDRRSSRDQFGLETSSRASFGSHKLYSDDVQRSPK